MWLNRKSDYVNRFLSRAKFYVNPIWNSGAIGYFGRGRCNKNKKKKNKNKNKKSSDHCRPNEHDVLLSPVHTGDYNRRFRQQLPNSATNCRRSNSATIVASVDMALLTSQWILQFLQRVSIACYAERWIIAIVNPSVRPSVTRWHWVKTTQATIMGSLLEDSPMTLVSSWLTSPQNSKGT